MTRSLGVAPDQIQAELITQENELHRGDVLAVGFVSSVIVAFTLESAVGVLPVRHSVLAGAVGGGYLPGESPRPLYFSFLNQLLSPHVSRHEQTTHRQVLRLSAGSLK